MRNNLNKRAMLTIAIALLGLIAFTLVKVVSSQEPNKPNKEEAQQLVEAIRKGGLREAARIKKHYVNTESASHWIKYDLESLTKNSGNIIVGTPIYHASQLSSNGEQITTEYQIKVEQSLKGKLVVGAFVNVSLLGGKVVFDDGTSAEIKIPDLEGMENGRTYVLFLSPEIGATGAFNLTGAGQGLFELSQDKGVKPHGHTVDIVQKHKNQNPDSFLLEIKRVQQNMPTDG
jgi:hypothetical protein